MRDIMANLNRTGRAVSTLCLVMQVVCCIMLGIGVVGIVMLAIGSPAVAPFLMVADNSSIVQLIDDVTNFNHIADVRLDYVDFAAFIVSQFVLLVFVHALRALVNDMTTSDRPFRVETARLMRKRAWLLVGLMLWNFLVGAMVVFVAVLASYLIEYGAYLQKRADETERVQEDVIVSLAEITENKSGQTGEHVRRVAEYTRVLADELGYPADRLDAVRLASTMHDIGKLLVPAEILEKPGPLDDEEYNRIKQHTTDGGLLLVTFRAM